MIGEARYRLCVVGCGRRYYSDQSVGLDVASHLRKTPGHACEVLGFEQCNPGFISELPPTATIVFVAGSRTRVRPGTVQVIRLGTECLKGGSGIKKSGILCGDAEILLKETSKAPQLFAIGIEMESWDSGIGVTSSVHAAAMEVVRGLAQFDGKGQPKLPFFTEELRSD